MLHEVAASDLDLTTIVNPIRKLLRKVQLFTGEVEDIDLPNSRLTLSHGFKRHSHTVSSDQLILALGSIANFHNLPGLGEHAITMKSLGDAVELRNRLIAHLEEADTDCARDRREPLLTFVVAEEGIAGVETIAAVNDLLRQALPLYRNLNDGMLRLVLVHPGAAILPELGPELGKYAQKKLEKRGIEIFLNNRVSVASEDSVRLMNGMKFRVPRSYGLQEPHRTRYSGTCHAPKIRDEWSSTIISNCRSSRRYGPSVIAPLSSIGILDGLSADSTTRPKAGQGGRSKRGGRNPGAPSKEVLVSHIRADGRHRTASGSSRHPGRPLFRVYRVVAMANGVPEQVARLG